MTPVVITEGEGPVILSMPHVGTWLPPDIAARLDANGRRLADTDWHIDRLYAGLLPGATVVRATVHRYAIDANRDPSGASLYPGQNTTGLLPVTDFDGRSIWRAGEEPENHDIEARREAYHRPYHVALLGQIERTRQRHGVVILYDCHSIRSRIPFLFDGVLPDLNIGTNSGASCARVVADTVLTACAAAPYFTHVLDGRFRGGWTTRHYGRPAAGVHAIQMELAQSAYLAAEAPPWDMDATRAARLREVLAAVLAGLDALARSGDLG
jgi:formiminoglutamase